MKKYILLGLGVVLLAAIIATTQVWSNYIPGLRLQGATLSSLSVDLLLSHADEPPARASEYSSTGYLHGAQDLVPGGEEYTERFWVYNKYSDASVRLLGKFVAGNQDWDKLSQIIEVQVVPHTQMNNGAWILLSQFSQYSHEISQSLQPNDPVRIVVRYRMVDRYPHDPDGSGPLNEGDLLGDEIQNLTTSGVGLELTTTRNQ